MPENALLVLVGSLLGLVLLAIGFAIGRKRGRGSVAGDWDDGDRERMVQMLHELGRWASDYSGNVSEYQDRIGEVTEAMRRDGNAGDAPNRVVTLLQQIVRNSDEMRTRLEAAEKQLERQTRQIETYLTEARTDGLTGLANRRAFDQELEKMFAAYRKGGRGFVLTLIDIDHFKAVNDTHGHQVGDTVLQRVAAMLQGELEFAVMVARFGGEEFAVISDGPLGRVAERMNEFRRKLSHERIDGDEVTLDITVSIGLSEPRDDLVVAPVIRRADEALYAAKKIGRDRVYVHDGRGPTLLGAPEVAR